MFFTVGTYHRCVFHAKCNVFHLEKYRDGSIETFSLGLREAEKRGSDYATSAGRKQLDV